MRNTILKKFFFAYIITAALLFYAVTLGCYQIDYKHKLDETSKQMYNQATQIAARYSEYANSADTLSEYSNTLSTISAFDDTSIMILSTDGRILISSNPKDDDMVIEDFDPTIVSKGIYTTGDFYGYFTNDFISVIVPISINYSIEGYVTIHKSLDSMRSELAPYFNTNYITLLVCLAAALVFIFMVYYEVHRPLNEITRAVKEYGHGNLNYKLREFDDDEIGRLAAALRYMSERLSELDDSQKKFIANVSHDFRSPLTSIKGYLEAILDGTIPHEMQDKYLNIVITETERLSKLTNNLLTLNSMDPTKNTLNLESFDINETIRQTITTFEGTCSNKGIKFDLTFSSKSLMVNADPDKIKQVLYNLIDNAIKFSHKDSIIYIAVNERGEKAFVSIKDSGIGIPKDSVNKIWERFYKTDLSRGKDKKGTGLGLSIVKEIINNHHENIDVISTEGVGTEFTFSLAKYDRK